MAHGRVGKTTLLTEFLKKTPLKYKLDSGNNIRTQETLSSQDFDQILNYAEGYDLIEERDGKLHAYELKWNPQKKNLSPPSDWKEYQNTTFQTITMNNYIDFIT